MRSRGVDIRSVNVDDEDCGGAKEMSIKWKWQMILVIPICWRPDRCDCSCTIYRDQKRNVWRFVREEASAKKVFKSRRGERVYIKNFPITLRRGNVPLREELILEVTNIRNFSVSKPAVYVRWRKVWLQKKSGDMQWQSHWRTWLALWGERAAGSCGSLLADKCPRA